MQSLFESQSSSITDGQETYEERLQRWRNAYQAYQIRLANFYDIQIRLKEQIKQQQEYKNELRGQQEDLERHRREIIQKRIPHSRRASFW